MTTATHAAAPVKTGLATIALVTFIGAAMVFAAGFAQSSVMHDAAHDVRHATGFPCH